MSESNDPGLAAAFRCYLTRRRVAWPYLVMLFGALALLVGALFAPV